MKAKKLDKAFDDGEDILEHFDVDNPSKPNQEQKSVNIDFPDWVINELDREAREIGVSRQALIKSWIVDRIKGHQV